MSKVDKYGVRWNDGSVSWFDTYQFAENEAKKKLMQGYTYSNELHIVSVIKRLVRTDVQIEDYNQ